MWIIHEAEFGNTKADAVYEYSDVLIYKWPTQYSPIVAWRKGLRNKVEI